MTRRYDEPVEVRRRDDLPAQFLWRGRLYVVRDVLDRWVETRAWWRSADAQGVYVLSSAPSAGPSAGASEGSGAARPTGLALDEDERELWRVEATRGRVWGSGVFDLAFDRSTGGWTLVDAVD